jgi:hypothetical protein
MSEIELLPGTVEQARQHVASFEAIGGTVAYPFSVRLARYVVLQHEELERLRRSPPQVGRGMEPCSPTPFLLSAIQEMADQARKEGRNVDAMTLDAAAFTIRALSVLPAEEGGSAAGAAPIAPTAEAPSATSMYWRKKPVVIEAMQWTGDNGAEVQAFLGGDRAPMGGWVKGMYVDIGTLEGLMVASIGDWIIKGVKGEFYPCKPDIFAATYEQAADVASPLRSEAEPPPPPRDNEVT